MFQALKVPHGASTRAMHSGVVSPTGESMGRPGVTAATGGPTPSALPVPDKVLGEKKGDKNEANVLAGSPASALSVVKSPAESLASVATSAGEKSEGNNSMFSFAAIAGQLVSSKLQKEGSKLRGENERLKEAMQAHVQITKRKIDALQAQMAEATALAEGVKERSARALSDAESKLSQALEEVKQKDEALRARDRAMEEMAKDTKSGEKDREALKGMLARVEAAEAKVVKAEARVAKLRRERDEALDREEGQVAALKAQLEGLVLEAAAESEAEVRRVAAEGALREREAMKTAVEADEARAQAEASLHKVEGEAAALREQIAGLTEEIGRVQSGNNAAEKLAAEAGAESSRLATLLQDAESRLGDADRARSEMETRITDLTAQVEEARGQVEEARAAASEVIKAKETLASEFASLSVQMEDLRSARDQLQASGKDLLAMREKVAAAQSAAADAEHRASETDRERHAAVAQAQELAEALANGAAERTVLTSQVQAAEMARAELEQALAAAELSRAEREESIRVLEGELANGAAERTALTSKVQAVETARAELEQALAAAESSKAEREASILELEGELQSLERLVASSSAEIEEEKAARAAAEVRVERAEAENTRLLKDSEEALRLAEGKVLRSVQEAMGERSKKEALAELNARLLQDSEEALLREKEALRAERASVAKLEEAERVNREMAEQHARDIEELRTARYQTLRADMEDKVGSPVSQDSRGSLQSSPTASGFRTSPGSTSTTYASASPSTPEQALPRELPSTRTPAFGQLGSPAQALMPKPRAWPKHVQMAGPPAEQGQGEAKPAGEEDPESTRRGKLRSMVARLGSAAAIGSLGAVCVLVGALKVSPALGGLARVSPAERQRKAQNALAQVRPNGVPAPELPFDLKRTQTFSIDLMA